MEAQILVPVTEEEKQRSIYKYFERDLAQAPPEKYGKMLGGQIRPDKALAFGDRNKLFDPGYFEEEVGWCVMPDGTGTFGYQQRSKICSSNKCAIFAALTRNLSFFQATTISLPSCSCFSVG